MQPADNVAAFGRTGRLLPRVGLGAMHLSLSGRPAQRDAVAVIHAALDAGTRFVDTANVYCLDDDDLGHNERLVRDAVAGAGVVADELLVATKGGMRRPSGRWEKDGSPAWLRASCLASAQALGMRPVELYYLHAPDPRVPIEESVEALARLRDEGLIRHVGLSNVDVRLLERASALVRIEAVQNRCSPFEAQDLVNGVGEWCREHGVAYVAYGPVGGVNGKARLREWDELCGPARRLGVDPADVALAWLLQQGEHIFPIPGARRVETARAGAAAATITLEPGEIRRIDRRSFASA